MRFDTNKAVATFYSDENAAQVTYNSGAYGNYISEDDRKRAGLPILLRSTKRVGVAHRATSNDKFATKLPFPQLSKRAAMAVLIRHQKISQSQARSVLMLTPEFLL